MSWASICFIVSTTTDTTMRRLVPPIPSVPRSGTAAATTDLVKRLGGNVHALAFLIELVALSGRNKLPDESIHSVLKY